MLDVTNLHTYYGHIHALKGISLEVDQGEIVTLIGSNGAGKSTTLKTISGLLSPRTGDVKLKGADDQRHAGPPGGRDGRRPVARKGGGSSPACR